MTGWESRDKAPGELVLNENRGSRRFYDFAGACRQAREEGWGFLPGELRLQKIDGRWHSWVDGPAQMIRRKNGPGNSYRPARQVRPKLFHAVDVDVNRAIRATYAQHRATMTAREYAAGAARRDFEHLQAWCDDEWRWAVLAVAPFGMDGEPDWDSAEYLGGISSEERESYLLEMAEELAGQIGCEA